MKGLMGAFIALNVSLYRLSGGRLMGKMGAAPILLLSTTGRKSGQKRTVPLLYVKEDQSFALVASFAGAPKHPAWYSNIEANPNVELQVGRQRFLALARRASADEKARLWPKLVASYPRYEDYQKRTTREIPVVIVTPVA
jgi:deazaflavin-dependent oxidoreductase (nitroreductase family)